MATAYDVLERFDRNDVDQNIHDSLIATREKAIGYQKVQLFSGIKNDETPIRPPYAPATVRRKRRKGQPSDRVTGFDSGSMYAGTFDDVREATFNLGSTSETFEKFVKRYGEDTFGLTPTNLSNLAEDTRPVFIDIVKEKLQL